MPEHAARAASRGWVLIGTAAVLVIAVLCWGGYAEGWAWTGLSSQVTLWDWLTLALLPLVLATSTLWRRPPHWTRRHVGLLVVATIVVVVLVLAGYFVPWAWTGFTGNTAWDWVKLLLLPVLLPVFVMPRLVAAAEGWLGPRADAEHP